MGVTADLMKATGEIRVHRVRTRQDAALVTLELVQAQVPGNGKNLACVRLSRSEAVRLGDMLRDAAIDERWYDEAARRLAAHKAGKVHGIPCDEVLGQRP